MYFSVVNLYVCIRWLSGKESACQCRSQRRHRFDAELGRSLGEGNYTPLQYFAEIISWTEESDGLYIVHGVAKSWTQLSMHHTHI